jgi:hypothetical protein
VLLFNNNIQGKQRPFGSSVSGWDNVACSGGVCSELGPKRFECDKRRCSTSMVMSFSVVR